MSRVTHEPFIRFWALCATHCNTLHQTGTHCNTGEERRANKRARSKYSNKSFYDILRASQWLPHPFTTFDALQRYLMAQWVPCVTALALYCIFQVDIATHTATHTATHCNTHCNTDCNTHCNTCAQAAFDGALGGVCDVF